MDGTVKNEVEQEQIITQSLQELREELRREAEFVELARKKAIATIIPYVLMILAPVLGTVLAILLACLLY